jgi:hypothetical protein
MRLALLTTFASSKKEQLALVLERIYKAFVDADVPEPAILELSLDTGGHRPTLPRRRHAVPRRRCGALA